MPRPLRALLALLLSVSTLVACSGDGGAPSADPTADAGQTGSRDAASSDTTGADGQAAGDTGNDGRCIDDRTFFEESVYGDVIVPVCSACHTSEGAARISDLIFVGPAQPDFLEQNRARLADVAQLERDGVSIILLKPTGRVDHGGGTVLRESSDELAILEEFVRRLDDPVECEPSVDPGDDDGSIALLPPSATLRKASLLLTGELPTPDAYASVRAGGEPALRAALDDLMQRPEFAARLAMRFNDLLLTERYADGNGAIGIVDDERFPGVYFYEAFGGAERNGYRAEVNEAVAREPIALIEYVIGSGRPFTEVLTADYVMVNDYSAVVYGLAGEPPPLDDPAARAFRPERIDGSPHVGLLTTAAFLNRFPTTATNRNRHRAWKFFLTFLATDILKLADRPVDSSESVAHNPTMNDPQCSVCHATMDPVAGLFQNWDAEGRYRPPELGWFGDMRPPGFGDETLPPARRPDALRWLAERAVEDPRFAIAIARDLYTILLGREPLPAIDEEGDTARSTVRREAWRAQTTFFEEVAAAFRESDHDVRAIVSALVMSPYFRAEAADEDAEAAAVADAGLARLLTPEELSEKIEATTGYPWRTRVDREDRLLDEYRLLYGGIDSDGVTERLRDPNGIMMGVAERMATEVACRHVPRDFSLSAERRRLFPWVEPDFLPVTEQGFDVPEVQDRIRRTIQHLHLHLLGEELPLDGEELQATYDLWMAVWTQGREAVQAGEIGAQLPWQCGSREDFFTGDPLPDERVVARDPDFTIRAWMAVTSYLLTDFRYLYE